MTAEFPKDHDNPKECQLIVCITGTPLFIREQLDSLNTYNKPTQGTVIHHDGVISVTTPVWRGEKY